MKNVFDSTVVAELTARINALTPTTKPQWGKMTVDQMLAHLSVAYEVADEDKHHRPNFFMRLVLRTIVKGKVVGPTPHPRSSPTAPAFRMTGRKDFARE